VAVRSVSHGLRGYLLTAATIALVFSSRMNCLWPIAADALAGIAGIV
jgi:hypothetical protein